MSSGTAPCRENQRMHAPGLRPTRGVSDAGETQEGGEAEGHQAGFVPLPRNVRLGALRVDRLGRVKNRIERGDRGRCGGATGRKGCNQAAAIQGLNNPCCCCCCCCKFVIKDHFVHNLFPWTKSRLRSQSCRMLPNRRELSKKMNHCCYRPSTPATGIPAYSVSAGRLESLHFLNGLLNGGTSVPQQSFAHTKNWLYKGTKPFFEENAVEGMHIRSCANIRVRVAGLPMIIGHT
ncbi:unnamed protein product [Hapterophycus canaliculatus]